jgi:hypothetical protein
MSIRNPHDRHPGEGRDPAFAVALAVSTLCGKQKLGPGLRRDDDFVGTWGKSK